jgi:hypothetical protein
MISGSPIPFVSLLLGLHWHLAAPPVPARPTEVGGAPLEIPSGRDGSTVLGAEESADAAKADAERAAAPARLPPPTAQDPRRGTLESLQLRLFPPPLTEEELDGWCLAVGLGPEAIAHARVVLQSYQGRLRGFAPRESLSLVAASFQWSDEGDRLLPLWSPVHVAMLLRRREHLEALRQAEQSMMAALLPLATIEVQPEARRLLFQRRLRIETSGAGRSPMDLDPIDLIQRLELPSTDTAAINETLDRYVRDADPLLRSRRDAALQLDLDLARLEMSLGPFWELTVDPEERLELVAELDALRRARGELDVPLRRAGRVAAETLIQQLSSEQAIAFADLVLRSLPLAAAADEHALARLLTASLDHPELDESHRQGRLAFHAAVRRKLLPLGLEAAELSALLEMLPGTRSGDEFLDRAAAIDRVGVEIQRLDVARRRRAAFLEAATGLRTLLTAPEQALLEEVAQFRDELAMRSGADAWLARLARERLMALEGRQAELEQAIERSAREAQEPIPPPEESGEQGALPREPATASPQTDPGGTA